MPGFRVFQKEKNYLVYSSCDLLLILQDVLIKINKEVDQHASEIFKI